MNHHHSLLFVFNQTSTSNKTIRIYPNYFYSVISFASTKSKSKFNLIPNPIQLCDSLVLFCLKWCFLHTYIYLNWRENVLQSWILIHHHIVILLNYMSCVFHVAYLEGYNQISLVRFFIHCIVLQSFVKPFPFLCANIVRSFEFKK